LSDLPVTIWDDDRKSLNCIEHTKAEMVHGAKSIKKAGVVGDNYLGRLTTIILAG